MTNPDAVVFPPSLPTLEHCNAEIAQHYIRALDGSFRLAWVSADDTLNFSTHANAIATGAITALSAGETPASVQAAKKRADEMTAETNRVVAELEAKQASDRAKRFEERHQREMENQRAAADRHRASYGRRV